jgi:hypothetical protein
MICGHYLLVLQTNLRDRPVLGKPHTHRDCLRWLGLRLGKSEYRFQPLKPYSTLIDSTHRVFAGGILQLSVGENEVPFDAHLVLLCTHSPFFEKAMDGRYTNCFLDLCITNLSA